MLSCELTCSTHTSECAVDHVVVAVAKLASMVANVGDVLTVSQLSKVITHCLMRVNVKQSFTLFFLFAVFIKPSQCSVFRD